MDHNQAVDGLLNLFSKANQDLSVVHNKLRKEFQQVYPYLANPMNLVSRLKKIEEEMPSLKDQCRELLAAKQDLIDKARTHLVGNRTRLPGLQVSAGVPVTCDADDPAFVSSNQLIWGVALLLIWGVALLHILVLARAAAQLGHRAGATALSMMTLAFISVNIGLDVTHIGLSPLPFISASTSSISSWCICLRLGIFRRPMHSG